MINPNRVKTVSKLVALKPLGLALSEKQIPQIVENTEKCGELLEPLEGDGMRPRQVRYQAALRPDIEYLQIQAVGFSGNFRNHESRTCQAKLNLQQHHSQS